MNKVEEFSNQMKEPNQNDSESLSDFEFGVRWSEDVITKLDKKHRQATAASSIRNYGQSKRHYDGAPNNHRKYGNDTSPAYHPFVPTIDVAFYQNDIPFEPMVTMMKSSCKTYELFKITQLILEKPERFVVTIRRKPNATGEVEPLYLSLPDGIPFETEEDAVAHIVKNHLDRFFEITEAHVDRPKGRFTCVHKCGITGKLLSAPNYHMYNMILQEHYDSELKFMSFGRFKSKIETVNDESEIQKWLEQMSKRLMYKPKQLQEGSNEDIPAMQSMGQVKQYLLENLRDKAIKKAITFRLLGTTFASMPRSMIKRSIDYVWQKQKKFPLDTANRLRGKLRSLHFSIYRKGKNGISYVCAVRRKFVPNNHVFTEEIRQLVEFIEKNNGINISAVEQKIRQPDSGINMPFEAVAKHLNWLIHEGYVIEYEDGKLVALPKLEQSKPKPTEQNSAQLIVIPEQSPTTLALCVDKETVIEPYNTETSIAVAKGTTLALSNSHNQPLQPPQQSSSVRKIFKAKLVDRKRLSGANAEKIGYHLVFENPDHHRYKSGDSLAIMPKNSEKDVIELLNRLSLDFNENISIGETEMPIGKALTDKLCLTHLTKHFWELLAERISDPKELAEYFDINNGDQQTFNIFLKNNGLYDILQKFKSIALSAQDLANALRKMPPRLYSIASSPTATPGEIHLLVAAVKYLAENNKERLGVASTYLCNRLQLGESADTFIVDSTFSLPEDSADMIMVGPGTGLAPFMSFLQERATRRAQGKSVGRNWLFFGEQHRSENFYYQDKLLSLLASGDLWRLDLAFSRDQETKIYVQDKMLENAEPLLEWIVNGACFYVCGDASKMAKDVETTLKTILAKHIADADDFVKQMRKDKRYLRDVY
ncbi:MAG: hypothetical protein LBH49_01330 [Puniceicoccales bacterium]|jgi:sulfite reductase (NADPH) flavoprotein alpha-component|nr:hypothetical protein [Puniceicoccales bacterium]